MAGEPLIDPTAAVAIGGHVDELVAEAALDPVVSLKAVPDKDKW